MNYTLIVVPTSAAIQDIFTVLWCSYFFSTENLTDADLGEPILDVVLEAGDLLYFPRGTIHQVRLSSTVCDNSHRGYMVKIWHMLCLIVLG